MIRSQLLNSTFLSTEGNRFAESEAALLVASFNIGPEYRPTTKDRQRLGRKLLKGGERWVGNRLVAEEI